MNRIPQWMQNAGNYLPSATKNLYNGFLSLPQKQKIASVFALLGLTLIAAGTAYYFRGRNVTPTPPDQGKASSTSKDGKNHPSVQQPGKPDNDALQGSASSLLTPQPSTRPRKLFEDQPSQKGATGPAAQPQETIPLSASPALVEGSSTSNPDDDQAGWTTVQPLKRRQSKKPQEGVLPGTDASARAPKGRVVGPNTFSTLFPQEEIDALNQRSQQRKNAGASSSSTNPMHRDELDELNALVDGLSDTPPSEEEGASPAATAVAQAPSNEGSDEDS